MQFMVIECYFFFLKKLFRIDQFVDFLNEFTDLGKSVSCWEVDQVLGRQFCFYEIDLFRWKFKKKKN